MPRYTIDYPHHPHNEHHQGKNKRDKKRSNTNIFAIGSIVVLQPCTREGKVREGSPSANTGMTDGSGVLRFIIFRSSAGLWVAARYSHRVRQQARQRRVRDSPRRSRPGIKLKHRFTTDLCSQLNSAASLENLSLGTLAEELEDAQLVAVNDKRGLHILFAVLLLGLLVDEGPQLVEVDSGAEELVVLFVEVTHTDLT